MNKKKLLSKNFSREEFTCKCGCGKNNISEKLVERLQRARDLLGLAIIVTSGCRCDHRNASEGGSPTSAHLLGLASDIACRNSKNRYFLICALLNVGFHRIGIGKGFIHVDIDYTRPTPSLFLYSK